jgi:hypothetical protein
MTQSVQNWLFTPRVCGKMDAGSWRDPSTRYYVIMSRQNKKNMDCESQEHETGGKQGALNYLNILFQETQKKKKKKNLKSGYLDSKFDLGVLHANKSFCVHEVKDPNN